MQASSYGVLRSMNEKSLVANWAGLLQDESGAEDSLNGVRVTAMQPHTLADRMAYVATRVSWSELEERVESTLESMFQQCQSPFASNSLRTIA